MTEVLQRVFQFYAGGVLMRAKGYDRTGSDGERRGREGGREGGVGRRILVRGGGCPACQGKTVDFRHTAHT